MGLACFALGKVNAPARRAGRARKRRKQGRFLAFSLFALMASAKPLAAADGNPVAGKDMAESERCLECHGQDGNSDDDRMPRHAGQYAGYLAKQLRDFQTGARKHPVMSVIAEDLTEADIADIAAYFASRSPARQGAAVDDPAARNLFVNGDQARAIKACISCHDDGGKGRIAGGVIYPAIGGQHKTYLSGQLVSWKLGERANSPGGVMNQIAKALTDEEIEALAKYISGL
jgi:cytochrome c553